MRAAQRPVILKKHIWLAFTGLGKSLDSRITTTVWKLGMEEVGNTI